jgi:hypothetical protein
VREKKGLGGGGGNRFSDLGFPDLSNIWLGLWIKLT